MGKSRVETALHGHGAGTDTESRKWTGTGRVRSMKGGYGAVTDIIVRPMQSTELDRRLCFREFVL